MEHQAAIFDLDLTAQAGNFFLQLLDTFLLGGFLDGRAGCGFFQPVNALLRQITAPLGQLVGIQLLAPQQLADLAMLAGVGLLNDRQLVLGGKLAARALLKL